LIAKADILQAVLLKKFAVPSLTNVMHQLITLRSGDKRDVSYLNAMQREVFMGRQNAFKAFKQSPARAILAFDNTILSSAFGTVSFAQKVAEAIMSQSFIQETRSEFQPFGELILFPSLARLKYARI
jgi:hypothetical protein